MMDLPSAAALAALTDDNIRATFETWVEAEKSKGLIDIKFALSNVGDGTVVDVMRQLLCIQADRAAGKNSPFFD